MAALKLSYRVIHGRGHLDAVKNCDAGNWMVRRVERDIIGHFMFPRSFRVSFPFFFVPDAEPKTHEGEPDDLKFLFGPRRDIAVFRTKRTLRSFVLFVCNLLLVAIERVRVYEASAAVN